MKKISILLPLLLFIACGVKQSTNYLNSGNYEEAIEIAVSSLQNNKNAKGKQDYIYILEEAFAKANERDLRNIDLWSKEANPANLEKIYASYVNLNNRQEKIRPLLPLQLVNENRNAIFHFSDYTTELVNSKNAFSNYLYTNSKSCLLTATKFEARTILQDLTYLNQINPGFKDVSKLIEEARIKGTVFVHVFTKNETNLMIPVRLQNDLLDFSTYGLNDKWTVYHSNRKPESSYDYGIILNFREIVISPEQIREKQIIKEKQIKDGVKNLVNANGVIVKDSLGNPIKIDNLITVKGRAVQFTQFKSCRVVAKVDYIDFTNNQLMNTYPLGSEFIFENIYATFRGDRRAFEEDLTGYFGNRAVPFPSNEQMVYDTGEDLKLKLKEIIIRNKIQL